MLTKLSMICAVSFGIIMALLFSRNRTEKKENSFDTQKLKTVAIATGTIMLLAYTFAYTNGMFLFDAAYIYRGINLTPQSVSDKWLSPYLSVLDMGVNMPWLGGVFAVLFMILSVYLIVDMLNITSKAGIWVVAGLCSTNSSIICQQEYTGGNYTGEVALLFACLAAWCANNGKRNLRNFIFTIPFCCFFCCKCFLKISIIIKFTS